MNIKGILYGIVFAAFILACTSPFAVNINSEKDYVIIEGGVTNLDEEMGVRIEITNSSIDYESTKFSYTLFAQPNAILPLQRAAVYVVVNGDERISLTEKEPGYYQFPSGFKGVVGNSYELQIATENGKKYKSIPEVMEPVPAIENAYDEFNPEGIIYPGLDNKIPTNDVFVDFTDPADQQNFYQWTWVDYELQRTCATCRQGKYYRFETENGETGDCYRDLTLNISNFYDYTCESLCWDKIYSYEVNTFTDQLTDGLPQRKKRVAQIPLFQSNPAMVAIRQNSLTVGAYRYLKLLENQAIQTGTLADTPPAPIQGNVYNEENVKELVLGYFNVSAVSEYRLMISRRNTEGAVLNSLFRIINKRSPNLEPESNERPDIPLAICKPSRFRSADIPRGWIFGL